MHEERVRELALGLASLESVTDGPGETAFGPRLAELLRASPAFAGRGDFVRLLPTLEDRIARSIVAGLVRGEGRRTILLTGHYDVVGTAAYGRLRDLAFSPLELSAAFVAELGALRATRQDHGLPMPPAEALALEDLESGAFMAGRGLLDMKAGLAAGIAVLERFAADRARQGNLLFMAVPDEEGASHGMRSAVRLLPALLEEWGLEVELAVNLDSSVDQGDGGTARALFLGSVGKTHPFVLFRGRPTHAGAPFDGVNPSLLAAEFVRVVESGPSLLGSLPGSRVEPPPPPTVLYHRDLRTSYEVTSPASVFTSLNVLTNEASPSEVLTRLSELVLDAMQAALGNLERKAALQAGLEDRETRLRLGAPRLLWWSELEELAKGLDPLAFESALSRALASAEPIPALAAFVEGCADQAGLEGPAAVIGLAPPYYPRASVDPGKGAVARILPAVRAWSETRGLSIALRSYFPGISDMSYLCPADLPGDRAAAARESPFGVDAAPEGFRCPTINVGPWGRDYHQRLERLRLDYAFRDLPELLWRIVGAGLAS